MKFDLVCVEITLLVLIHFVVMYNDRSHRSVVKKSEITVHASSSSEFWIILLLPLNPVTVIMIWLKLSCSSTGGKRMQSSEQQTTPEVVSHVDDPLIEESFQCNDLIHINRSTAKILINEMIERVKRAQQFGIVIKPDTLPDQKF